MPEPWVRSGRGQSCRGERLWTLGEVRNGLEDFLLDCQERAWVCLQIEAVHMANTPQQRTGAAAVYLC